MTTESKWKRCTDGQIQTILVLNCSQITKGGEGVPGCVHWSQHNNVTRDFFFLLIEVKYKYWIYLLRWLSKREKVSMAGKGVSFALKNFFFLYGRFKYTSAKKKVKLQWNVFIEVHKGAWNCMKNMLYQAQPVQTVRIHHFGESVWTHSMSYSSPESLLLLRQQLVVGLWLNILCLLVECVLTFCMFRFPSILIKMFSGVSSP